ncbi:hypothetical protein SAMN06272759_1563 [Novosphingobium sp. B1]|nr:hypothetical protein SAMN06272759_1563 [Novosphingobium sp. B1]
MAGGTGNADDWEDRGVRYARTVHIREVLRDVLMRIAAQETRAGERQAKYEILKRDGWL